MTTLPTWIAVAIENGGTLRVYHEENHFVAWLYWPTIKPVLVSRPSLDHALDALNTALMEDAATEMSNNPRSGV